VYLGGPYLVGEDETIEWHVEGDYYATLVLFLGNGTRVLQDYPENRVHVEPASVLREEKRSQNIQTLEIAAFAFGFTWVISLVEHRLGERKDDSIGRLDADTNQKTNATADKREGNAGREEGKKGSVQQEHHEKDRKQHQRSPDVNE
jgi:hypothetical protein